MGIITAPSIFTCEKVMENYLYYKNCTCKIFYRNHSDSVINIQVYNVIRPTTLQKYSGFKI